MNLKDVFMKNKKAVNDSDPNQGFWVNLFNGISKLFKKWSIPVKSKRQMLEAYHKSPWLYLAVDIISKNIASAELYVEASNAKGEATEIPNHPVLELLKNPNPLLLGFTQEYAISAYLELSGEVVLLLDRASNGLIENIFPISAEFIHEMPYNGFPFYRLRVGTSLLNVPISEVIYIKTPDMGNLYGRGLGKAQSINDEIAVHEMAGKQIGQYFNNNAIPPYLFGLEGGDREAAERVQDDFLNKNQGWAKRYMPHFMPGKINAVRLQSEFKDMELNNMRAGFKDEIMQFFQVPKELYGDTDNSNRSTVEAAETNFAKQVIKPRLDFRMAIYNNYLMPEFSRNGITFTLKYRNVVPRDKTFIRDTKEKFSFAFTLNELRAEVGAEPLQGFDDLYAVKKNYDLKSFSQLTFEEQNAIKSFQKAKSINIEKQSIISLLAIANSIEDVPEEQTKDVFNTYLETGLATGFSVFEDLGFSRDDYNDTRQETIDNIIDFAGNKVKLIDETTKQELRNQLVMSVQEGESISEIKKRIKDNVFTTAISGVRAEKIARTESIGNINLATLDAYKQAEVPNKEWISTGDDRTRDSHASMDYQTVGVKENFVSGAGNSTQAPGQFGVAYEDINCRCTIAANFSEKSLTERQQYWQKQDQRAIDIEADFKKSYGARFEAQEELVMNALDELEG